MSLVFIVKNMAFRMLLGSFPPGTGRPGVPPLQKGPKLDSTSGTGDREGRPYAHLSEP